MTATHRNLTYLTPSFPTLRSSDLRAPAAGGRRAFHLLLDAAAGASGSQASLSSSARGAPCRFSGPNEDGSSSSSVKVITSPSGPQTRTGVSGAANSRSEEHTSELASLMRISYAVFCLKQKT